MNVQVFQRMLLQTLLVPVLLLLTVASALIWQIEDMVKSEYALDHSAQAGAQLRQLERLIIDQETGLRGYQLTGDRVMLQPYEEASAALPDTFKQLGLLVAGNGELTTHLAAIHDRYESWLAFAHSALLMRPDAVRDPALNL